MRFTIVKDVQSEGPEMARVFLIDIYGRDRSRSIPFPKQTVEDILRKTRWDSKGYQDLNEEDAEFLRTGLSLEEARVLDEKGLME